MIGMGVEVHDWRTRLRLLGSFRECVNFPQSWLLDRLSYIEIGQKILLKIPSTNNQLFAVRKTNAMVKRSAICLQGELDSRSKVADAA
jgi:hypothetical protein